ncbi:MAG: hypothetical protein WBX11_02455, partial [Thiobacillaceae bacterium]
RHKPKPLLCSASTQAVPSNRITPILFRLQYQGTHSFMAPNFGLEESNKAPMKVDADSQPISDRNYFGIS